MHRDPRRTVDERRAAPEGHDAGQREALVRSLVQHAVAVAVAEELEAEVERAAGGVPAQLVGSGLPPPNGTPSRFGSNVSAWVVASVVSTRSLKRAGSEPSGALIVVYAR